MTAEISYEWKQKTLFSHNKIASMNTNLLKDAKLMKTSAVGCAAQAASILKMHKKEVGKLIYLF